MAKDKILEVLFLIIILIFSSYANAFGVAYSEFLCPSRPLKMFPGQEKTVELILQNMVGDEDVNLAVKLRDSNGIAKVKEKAYTVRAKTENTAVFVNIKIPIEADVGSKFDFAVAFDTISSGEGGGVALGTGMDVKICIEVVPEYPVEPQLSPQDKDVWWVLAGIIIFILSVIIIVMIILKRKKYIFRN